ncbi:MAG TPA: HlyD family efflux transporter periplasmic adaptor subunit [Candidatus Acidoferrum sp.]|nr:HlyD family efflux transporter periplasmic adaptor subunit [Candidatus Acidoferrum sp.]
MDRKIEKSRKPFYIKVGVGAVLTIGLAVAGFGFMREAQIPTFRLEKSRVSLGTVQSGIFEDFIPVRGTVTPLKSILLAAADGGRVEKLYVENGAIVKTGQPIIELSNTTLQSSVLTAEAQITQGLNGIRDNRRNIQDYELNLRKELAAADNQIRKIEQQIERRKLLAERKLVTNEDIVNLQDDLSYQKDLRKLIASSLEEDEKTRKVRSDSLDTQESALLRSLEVNHKSLDDLVVRAPFDGQLSGLSLDLGQTLIRGGSTTTSSLGQIDDTEHFKLKVQIDEYYITRTREGQTGETTLNDKTFKLHISRVFPEVSNGQFSVDMEFDGVAPTDIRRGQTLQTRLQLGDAGKALLLPRGGFFQDTGGNWAFVVDKDGKFAGKRNIRLGRRNAEYFEVLEGLAAGEQVITSEYGSFKDMERIVFE